jgi:hypothetical protein
VEMGTACSTTAPMARTIVTCSMCARNIRTGRCGGLLSPKMPRLQPRWRMGEGKPSGWRAVHGHADCAGGGPFLADDTKDTWAAAMTSAS